AGDAPPLYDITTEAALLMPCALGHLQMPLPPTAGPKCGELAEAGLVNGATDADRASDAYDRLRTRGWTDDALRSGALSVSFDLWKSIAATYASAYGRFGANEHPCGFTYAAVDASGTPRAATDVERAAWWADASGIPPGAGVMLVPPKQAPIDALRCLRDLWAGKGAPSDRVRAGVRETHASLPRAGIPITIVHGVSDGLIPVAFTSAPYVQAARAAGRDVRFWQVRNAQHFDAFLQLPPVGANYVPLLPYVYAALDRTWSHLYDGAPMPADAMIATTPRGAAAELTAQNLAIPTN
ncbi:3-hydroxybutyrate oligomer hydrolase family protein, partial [Cognatilysobacter terrigena]